MEQLARNILVIGTPAIVPIGSFYGGLFGVIVGPLADPFLVRKIGFVGGFVGAVAGLLSQSSQESADSFLCLSGLESDLPRRVFLQVTEC